MDFMAFDAGAIARELTLIEFGLFYNIRPRELLNQAWQREDKEKKAPNISLLIARFNEVCAAKPQQCSLRIAHLLCVCGGACARVCVRVVCRWHSGSRLKFCRHRAAKCRRW
jgi:hypothetical protein